MANSFVRRSNPLTMHTLLDNEKRDYCVPMETAGRNLFKNHSFRTRPTRRSYVYLFRHTTGFRSRTVVWCDARSSAGAT